MNALRRVGVEAITTDDVELLRTADKVIFPGVGEASTAMAYLRDRGLDAVILSMTQPVLGICLGMQLLCAESEENGTRCLGILPHCVRRFSTEGLKVPHIGWNTLTHLRSPIFDSVKGDSHVYFVHGYFVEPLESSTAISEYGERFSAAIQRGNFYGVQFHPEKSGKIGERILRNFLNL